MVSLGDFMKNGGPQIPTLFVSFKSVKYKKNISYMFNVLIKANNMLIPPEVRVRSSSNFPILIETGFRNRVKLLKYLRFKQDDEQAPFQTLDGTSTDRMLTTITARKKCKRVFLVVT